jgi:polysaccharide export outer membrane protein
MAGSFVAIADDASAPVWNPAGIAQLESNEGTFMYGTPSHGYLSVGVPCNRISSCFGFSYANSIHSGEYVENSLLLNYAVRLSDFLNLLWPRLYMGLNLKCLTYIQDVSDKDFLDALFSPENSKSVFSLDAGMLYQPAENLSLGFSALDLIQPDIGLTKKNRVPIEMKFGGAYKFQNAVSALDVTSRDNSWNVSLGGEIWFFQDKLGLRTGMNLDEIAFGISYRWLKIQNLDVQLDYSFNSPYDTTVNSLVHRVSLTLRGKIGTSETKEKVSKIVEEMPPYVLGPNDIIKITVRRHPELSGQMKISPSGEISLPILGDVKAEGFTKYELADELKQALSSYIIEPDITIGILEYRSKVVYVLGEVARPGRYSMEGSIWTVRDAIAEAGLPTGIAATWRTYVITPRPGRPIYRTINLYKILYRGRMEQNLRLQPGDIVYVPSTVLGKISSSLSHVLDPFFKAKAVAEPTVTGTSIPSIPTVE